MYDRVSKLCLQKNKGGSARLAKLKKNEVYCALALKPDVDSLHVTCYPKNFKSIVLYATKQASVYRSDAGLFFCKLLFSY